MFFGFYIIFFGCNSSSWLSSFDNQDIHPKEAFHRNKHIAHKGHGYLASSEGRPSPWATISHHGPLLSFTSYPGNLLPPSRPVTRCSSAQRNLLYEAVGSCQRPWPFIRSQTSVVSLLFFPRVSCGVCVVPSTCTECDLMEEPLLLEH